MKKLHLMYMVALLSALCSCKKDVGGLTDTDMSLSISGGVDIEMVDGDISKDLLISCSSPAKEDIVVGLTTSVDENTMELSATQIIIKKGTKSVAAKATFKIGAFPEGTPETIILIKILTRTPNVQIETISTEFPVRGFIPLTLTSEVNGTEFNTFEADVELKITLTLSKGLENDLSFALTAGEGSTEILSTLFTEPVEMKVETGKKIVTKSIIVPKGSGGVLILNINTITEGVNIETLTFSLNFTSERGD